MNNEYHNCTSNDLDIPLATQIATQGVLGLDTVHSLMLDPYRSDLNIYGVDKTKIIEKLEKEINSANAATRSAHKRESVTEKENATLQKENIRLEKRDKKRTKSQKNMEIEFKILKDVNQNLKNCLDNS